MLYTVEAMVIRTIDYGEGHKIVTLLTKERGKVSVMARGAKKMRSRFAAMTQLFTHGYYTYYRTGQMGNLSSGEIIQSFHTLQEDLMTTAYGAYLLEMINRMLLDHDGSSVLFEQLVAALQALEAGKDAQVITHIFELKMLDFAGYTPSIQACAHCADAFGAGGAPSAEPLFSAPLGGVICQRCAHHDPQSLRISSKTHKLLFMLQQIDLRQVGSIQVSAESKQQLKLCLRAFMNNHVSEHWKARNFLDQLEQNHI